MKVGSALMGIALVGVSAVALHLWRELEEGRQQIAILASKLQERQPPTAASPIPTPAQTSITAVQPSQATTEPQLLGSPDKSALIPKGFDAASVLKRKASPEGMALRRSQMRNSQEHLYPDVDQALGLTTSETDRLLDLLTTQVVRGMETVVSASESASDPEARNWKRRETENAELQALLGSKYPKW
jgi:uncharacterized coiled-coil protein SlyX